jgi:mono/diheme cytochrome c family protein
MDNKIMNRKSRRLNRAVVGALAASVALLSLAGCHTDMWTQPVVHKPLQESDFFADGSSARPVIPGTVSHKSSEDQLRVQNSFYSGIGADKKLVDELPASIPFNKETLLRGQERFNIYCSPCHGRLGDGKGMIAMRGLALRKTPGNYHTARLRKMPLGHFYDVITNGFGVMYSYSARVEPDDRWKIAAYIRVLQASQKGTLEDVPSGERETLLKSTAEQPASTEAPHAPGPEAR